MTTFPGLSLHHGAQGFFVAFGYVKAEHDDPETFRVSPYYASSIRAASALDEKIAEYRAATPSRVRDILSRDNVTEPSGEWSAYDVARYLDPTARKPRSMFDTGPDTAPRPEYVKLAEETIAEMGIGGRYVGGTSVHLYSVGKPS